MKRGVDLRVNEVSQEEKAPRGDFCDGQERLLRQPNFEVHDTIDIRHPPRSYPGQHGVRLAAGLRGRGAATGVDRRRRERLEPVLTDELVELRRRCVHLEASPPMRYARATGSSRRGCSSHPPGQDRFAADVLDREPLDIRDYPTVGWCTLRSAVRVRFRSDAVGSAPDGQRRVRSRRPLTCLVARDC